MPSKPPSPPSAVGAAPTLDIKDSLKTLPRIAAFYLQLLSFSVFAGALAATVSAQLYSIYLRQPLILRIPRKAANMILNL